MEPFVTVAETHSGVVVCMGERAYKLKKPLALGFLDFSRREVRRAVCRREVELNSRLAPDVYLGVADVLGTDGIPCDHLVVMRRLPADRRLSTLVVNGEPVDDDLRRLAQLLAGFHGRAERRSTIDNASTADALVSRWERNASRMVALPQEAVDPERSAAVLARARRYLAGRSELFAERIGAGRTCDGHGDLLADDIFCLPDGPRVLDCLEFDDWLRYGDVLGDVAFLAMDLERLGRPDLGAEFLGWYRQDTGDTWPSSLAHHYVAYRAQVRAMVAGIRAEQGDDTAAPEARLLMDIAHRHLAGGRVRVVMIGGLPGSGKSTLAGRIGQDLDAVVLRSDEVRRTVTGGLEGSSEPGEPHAPGTGPYRPEAVARTYEKLLHEAEACLRRGYNVVLDATFNDPGWRHCVRRLAEATAADLDELRCAAPLPALEARVQSRLDRGRDPSEATTEVLGVMARTERPGPEATAVDTDKPPEQVAATLRARLRTADALWPAPADRTGAPSRAS